MIKKTLLLYFRSIPIQRNLDIYGIQFYIKRYQRNSLTYDNVNANQNVIIKVRAITAAD